MPDHIRAWRDTDFATTLAVINAAAVAYRGVIPPDQWHEPYMSATQLREELAAGVAFCCLEHDGELLGVMGMQPVRDVDLIRHAYVVPGVQRRGVGSALIRHLRGASNRRMLVGTWAAAQWAIDFYRRHGFELVPPPGGTELLRNYWDIPERQLENSVVLANPA